jgi:hypothetical protein
MLAEERIAAARLAADGFSELVGGVRDTHAAIARRVFDSLGAPSQPIEHAHSAIAALAYETAGAIGRTALTCGGGLAALAAGPDATPVDADRGARIVRGALSGAFGDALERRENPLRVTMSVRVAHRDVELRRPALAAAFPEARPRIAVFLHGLCESDDAWQLHARRSRPYGVRLRDELGVTPVYVRYNSGLHVSDNGRRLAALLEALDRAWPVGLEEIALIGHSVGGLLARSACHYGAAAGWTSTVRDIVMLGTPHTGAPLERGAQALQAAFLRVPETRPLARALGARSAGVRDCGHGYLTDECWHGQDPDAFLQRAAEQVPFLDSANHFFFAASLARDHDHPFGRFVGDLLVLHASAWGGWRRSERVPFGADNYRHVGGASHFSLLNHPAVGDQLVRWLSVGPGQRP